MKSKLLLILVFLAFTFNLISQITATGHVFAEIIDNPITISKNVDMNFDSIQINSNKSAIKNTNNAKFTITGKPGYIYSVTLPTSISVKSTSSSMIVDSFSNSSSNTIDDKGNSTLNVGATLNVNSNQAIEKYNSNELIVMINYN